MPDEQIANEGEHDEKSVGRGGQGHPGEPLDKGRHEIAGKMGRGEENVGHVEETRPVFDV